MSRGIASDYIRILRPAQVGGSSYVAVCIKHDLCMRSTLDLRHKAMLATHNVLRTVKP